MGLHSLAKGFIVGARKAIVMGRNPGATEEDLIGIDQPGATIDTIGKNAPASVRAAAKAAKAPVTPTSGAASAPGVAQAQTPPAPTPQSIITSTPPKTTPATDAPSILSPDEEESRLGMGRGRTRRGARPIATGQLGSAGRFGLR